MRKEKYRIAAALTVLFLLITSFAGCGRGAEEAEAAVTAGLDALKSLDYDTAGKYLDIEAIASRNGDPDSAEAFLDGMLRHFDYNILSSSQISPQKVLVNAEITAVDAAAILEETMRQSLTLIFSDPEVQEGISEENLQKKIVDTFNEAVRSSDGKTVTNAVEITVMKEDGDWKIHTDQTFINAVLGGLDEAADAFEEEPQQ